MDNEYLLKGKCAFDGLKKHVDKARGGEVCTPPAITKQKSQVNYGFGGFIPLQHQRYR